MTLKDFSHLNLAWRGSQSSGHRVLWTVWILAGWWFGTFLFFHILGKIIPTDYISEGFKTTHQLGFVWKWWNLVPCVANSCGKCGDIFRQTFLFAIVWRSKAMEIGFMKLSLVCLRCCTILASRGIIGTCCAQQAIWAQARCHLFVDFPSTSPWHGSGVFTCFHGFVDFTLLRWDLVFSDLAAVNHWGACEVWRHRQDPQLHSSHHLLWAAAKSSQSGQKWQRIRKIDEDWWKLIINGN